MSSSNIIREILSYDKILIGIGQGVYRRDKLPIDSENWDNILQYTSKGHRWKNINRLILKLIEHSNYFVITSSWDSHLKESIPEDRLYTPFGNCKKIQCYNSCSTKLWDIDDFRDLKDQPLCPDCGSKLVMNTKTDSLFIDDPYTFQESNFHNWIHRNYSEKLLIIEWEVDKNSSRDIKEPFENIITALPNTKFIRINSKNISVPEVIKGISTTLKISPTKFKKLIKEY